MEKSGVKGPLKGGNLRNTEALELDSEDGPFCILLLYSLDAFFQSGICVINS